MSGLSARTVGSSRPTRSAQPGAKFWRKTSAERDEPLDLLTVGRVADVDRHAPLAAVHPDECRGDAVRDRVPAARDVAALRRLDLHDVRAEVGEEARAERSGEPDLTGDHADPVEEHQSSRASRPRVSPTRSPTARTARSVPATYGSGTLPRVVADRQPLAGRCEDDLRGDDEAREPHRVDLRAGHRCAACLGGADERFDLAAQGRLPHLAELLRQLARGAARDIGLLGARVVDDLPGPGLAGGLARDAKERRREDREVAGRDHADFCFTRACCRSPRSRPPSGRSSRRPPRPCARARRGRSPSPPRRS